MGSTTKSTLNMTRYLRLVRRFPLLAIENDRQHDEALAVMYELLDFHWKWNRTPEEDAYLNALTDLIWVYDERNFPKEPVEDRAMLEHFLESRCLTQAELARGAGISRSTISAVLLGKRKLTRRQICRIAAWLDVSPDVFSLAG